MTECRPPNTFPTPESGEQPPGLYIHIPFCVSKCAYCSFTSYPCAERPPAEYVGALLQEAKRIAAHPWAKERTFTTLFVGGGTPAIYDKETLAELVASCFQLFQCTENPEVTVETNPNTIDAEKLQALKRGGVNRLSIGIQSFSDRVLGAIGRTHTAAEAENAVLMAREAGFDNLNLDLIYGLPEQGMAEWQQSLETVLKFEPEHLALYELTVEEGTLFAQRAARGELPLPSEEAVIKMAERAQEQLKAAGYIHYEISNFSKPGRQCRHNINYWQNGSYLGLGAAAVSCLSGVRIKNVSDPAEYVRLLGRGRVPYAEAECLSLEARFRETVIMGMRMLEGISIESLAARFGLTPQQYYGKTIENLIKQGLVETRANFLRLTGRGRPVANQVLAQLV